MTHAKHSRSYDFQQNRQTFWRSLSVLWRKFARQKSAKISALLFALVCVLALAAPIIANDKPILVYYPASQPVNNFLQQTSSQTANRSFSWSFQSNSPASNSSPWFFPVWRDYPETAFGGVFETSADFSDPALMAHLAQHGWVVMPPITYAAGTIAPVQDGVLHPSAPSKAHWLGTDSVGRDVLARVLYGLRTSLGFALLLTLLGACIGVAFGTLMGYVGGAVDLLGQRFLEIWLGLPQLFILAMLASVFAPSWWLLFAVMLAFSWVSLVQVVRVQMLQLRNIDYALAARNLGVSHTRIAVRHLLPPVLAVACAQLPFVMVANISALAALDFLGFGLPATSASLGELLAQGKNHLDSPHLLLVGVAVLGGVLTLLVFIGDGLRELIDER
ncbi:hypothetical protein B0181_05530 [Moraxella caviae]|uniref:Inner membrane ABC transporter permease protein yejE n=1 Tax=Moraxella caviae TaxID=34060 RepID=A0A1T0A309_9GAMM|nr:ABC transporter permease subunit [Moraxella caviae]OOR90104.1 hypothetical protein B0181_05530 [Moraxella caviae]STZ14727.1 Inner membrane ABC transporter permease protein yejE [Moraxella caviae]VEW14034.1 Inner membrane ABC transporter permease protein yejE [Moraxella caviae]